MNITFRQMRLFLALADSGSVSAAAQRCHVTQPTASMQLREVNLAIGMPVYEVVGKRVHLTAAGQDLASTARQMVDTWDSFAQRMDALQGLTRGQLRVAVVSTAKYFVPRLLGSFCASHPDIDIALEVQNRDGVVARLRDNRDDLYIMSMPPADIPLEDQLLMPNPLVLIAPSGHALAKRRQLALSELAELRFILRERGSGTRMATDAHFRQQRFRPRLRLELGSNEAIKEAVAGGLGLAVVSEHALQGQASALGLCTLDVQGFPVPSQWHLVHRRGKQLSPIAQVFRAHLVQQSKVWARAQGTPGKPARPKKMPSP